MQNTHAILFFCAYEQFSNDPFGFYNHAIGIALYFPYSLLRGGRMLLASPMGQFLFALRLTCVCFIPINFLSVKGTHYK